jgi:hypothetical protein
MNLTPEMYLSQTEYAVIVLLACFIAFKFWQMRNGRLRKLMILYFVLVGAEHGLEWLYYGFWDIGYLHNWNEVTVRAVCHFPKVAAMVLLAAYLLSVERKNITVH